MMHPGRLFGPFALAVAAGVAGCASVGQPEGSLTGSRSALVTGVDLADRAVVPVEHVFELTNPGPEPVTIVSGKARISTTWHFADTGAAKLPREVAPGETVPVVVTAKVRRPELERFYVLLTLDSGEVVRLDLDVSG